MSAPLLPDDEQPLRIKMIAHVLGISDKTVRRRIDRLEIKSVKIGGLRVVLRRDFNNYWQKVIHGGREHV